MSVSLLDPTATPASTSSPAAAPGEAVEWLERGVEGLAACMDEVDPAAAMVVVERAIRRLQAVKLALVAQADAQRLATRTGMATTTAWLAKTTNTESARAARAVKLAQALASNPAASRPSREPGFVAPPRRPVEQANRAGDITEEHAQVIVTAIDQLPPNASAEQVLRAEADLVGKAERFSPQQLRRAARRALAVFEPDDTVVDAHENALVADEEARAYAKVRFTLHDNNDGTMTGHFTVPTLQGQLLGKILQTMTAPRRARLGASPAQVGENTGTHRDWARAQGEAFAELIQHLPTDHLHPTSAATIIVTITEDTLRDRLKTAQLDTGTDISAGQARRLACTAGILPAVLGGESLPLDLGRKKRLFSEAQRTALALQHTTCAATGCERPFAWCELHHRQPWSHGGTTDLADAIPLCAFHHQRIHDHTYLHRHTPDGITFHQRR